MPRGVLEHITSFVACVPEAREARLAYYWGHVDAGRSGRGHPYCGVENSSTLYVVRTATQSDAFLETGCELQETASLLHGQLSHGLAIENVVLMAPFHNGLTSRHFGEEHTAPPEAERRFTLDPVPLRGFWHDRRFLVLHDCFEVSRRRRYEGEWPPWRSHLLLHQTDGHRVFAKNALCEEPSWIGDHFLNAARYFAPLEPWSRRVLDVVPRTRVFYAFRQHTPDVVDVADDQIPAVSGYWILDPPTQLTQRATSS